MNEASLNHAGGIGRRVSIGACISALCLCSCACNSGTRTQASAPSAAPASAAPASDPAPLSAKLSVLVRTANRRMEPIVVDEPGALPVQDGGAMYLEAQLDQPAFVYFVWIDVHGKILPLYPWNNEELLVVDFKQPPPVRRATDRVFSPLLGRDWQFGDTPGVETVVLLARREALTDTTQLEKCLTGIAASRPQQQPQLLALSLDADGQTIRHLAKEQQTPSAQMLTMNEPLVQAMRALGAQFDVVQVVQFPHSHQKSAPANP